jgi:hypothetical protein
LSAESTNSTPPFHFGCEATFDPVRGVIASGFDPETRALQPFIDRAGDVQATLAQAPSTLATLSSDLPSVSALVGSVGDLAQQGDPTLALLPPALTATSALLHDGQPALKQASGTLALLQSAVGPTLSLLHQVSPVEPDLTRSMADLLPTVSNIAPRYCELSNAFTGWSSMMKFGTSYNNVIRFYVEPVGNPLAGGTGSPLVPTIKNATLVNPYPGPCVNGWGEVGPPRPTAATEAKGLTYSAQNEPFGPNLDLGSGK